MVLKKTLFDDNQQNEQPGNVRKEVMPVEKLKNLEDKIAAAIERVKTLKEEKAIMERRITELEGLLNEKSQEIEHLRSEKNTVKTQIEGLLKEIE
ncbi:MAG: cell division protein ZapB, partial [Nitrospira sp.]|nr:cell division protein ZapB [Nitrospira sp.]